MNSMPAPPNQATRTITIQSIEASALTAAVSAGAVITISESIGADASAAPVSTGGGASSVNVGMNNLASGNAQSK